MLLIADSLLEMSDDQSVNKEWGRKKAPLMTRWAEQVFPLLHVLLLFLLIRFDVDGTTASRCLQAKPPTLTTLDL